MRPVLLEMNGFASFREPTTVDFAGADYFALVGPTGAGKSTVIDAMTFALYGSVPRWDNQRTVALALAPTAGRGAVRFVFDVGGQRYVVARELRRAASGGVSVRNARLERLTDPAGLGAVAEETEPLADGAAATTDAVQELLGLPFGDFCTCVVLPQGDFAEFLHAEPRKRQEKLVRILGLGLYDAIARAANSEAAEAKLRAEVLTEQLAGYADATAEAERQATARVRELDGLAARVAAAVPKLAAAVDAQRDAAELVRRARGEQELLRSLTRPAGLDQLHERERAASTATREATERVAAAEQADGAARTRLAAAPDRGGLERLRHEHAELATGRAELPGLADRAEKALADYELAAQDAADAQLAVDRARAAREVAAAAVPPAQETVRRLVAERAGFHGVRVPERLDELDARQAAAGGALRRADAALAAAEDADSRARSELAAAPARPPLERAQRDGRALVELADRRRAAVTALAAAEHAAAAAAEAASEIQQRWEHAQARLRAEQRENVAATLRPTLVAGDDCLVCAQRVHELPAPLPAGDLDAAEVAAEAAGRAREQARERAVAAEAAQVRAREAVIALDESAGRLWAGMVEAVSGVVARAPVASEDRAAARLFERLATVEGVESGVPRNAGTPAVDALASPADVVLRGLGDAVDEVLDGLDRLAERAATADAAVRAARQDRAVAARAAAEIGGQLAAATTELRAARDRLVPFGAPPVADETVLAGWTALVTWARAEAATRDRALPEARAAAAAAEAALDGAEQQLRSAERAARDRRADETAAARAEQEARDAAAALDRRVQQLRTVLADAPTDAEAAAELARRDQLEAAAAAADAGLRAARAELRSAERAGAEVARETGTAWQALRAARDPLVPLNAPALPDDLGSAWTTLLDWARDRATAGDQRLAIAEAAVREAETQRWAVEGQVSADLAEHAVAVGEPLVQSAPPAVAGAVERARGEQRRVAERRAAAARIAADRDAAQATQQVARMLGGLLRSDGFPRWLVASALDALVADASAMLAELSGGQFELAHSGGEFLVVDHADADARRPVKTLSGGETFQASLALALALSAQLSGLAAEGAPRLESIFLDEGFGTLDEANLEIVASTLENLAARGDRVVGLITHVPALAERVPVRFAVSRDERGSSVVRENL